MIPSEPDFEQFFVAHYEQLVRSLTVITGDQELARDSVQDAFIKAAGRWRKVQRQDNPVGWVRRVAINRSRDLHRSNRRRRRREERGLDPASLTDPGAANAVDGSLNLLELLGRLPAQQRTAVSLFYVEDLPVAEIASIMKISSGAVKFHLSQARSSLRRSLEGEAQDHG